MKQYWEIISHLIHSKDNQDIIDGLYVIEYMLKTSQKEPPDISKSIIDNIKENFASQLLKLIYPNFERRISQDSFRVLRLIIEESILSKYSLEALRIAMDQIINDNDYSNYIQLYVWHFENASRDDQQELCDFMYDLTRREDRVGKRASELYNFFIHKI